MSNADPDLAPPPPDALELEVRGRPVPKGAVSAFVVPGKSGARARAVVVQGGSKAKRSALNEWQAAIQDAALVASGSRELEVARFVGMPVHVVIVFRLGRPKSHYGTGKNAARMKPDAPPYPVGTPDIDKLSRAVLDALIGVAFDDDSRVVRLETDKVYDAHEGATIRIRAMTGHLAPVLALVPPSAVEWKFTTASAAANVQGIDRLQLANLEAADAQLELPVDGAEKKRRARERIQRSIAGTQADGELRVMGKSHALERHVPPTVDPITAAIIAGDRGEFARRLLAAPPGSTEERRCLDALASPPVRPPDEDDFG